jgi:PAS domain S-box-containing protein
MIGVEIMSEIENEIAKQVSGPARPEMDRPRFTLVSRDDGRDDVRALFQSAFVGVAKVALDGRILMCNPAFSRLVGYSPAELERKTFGEITHPEDLENDWENVYQLLRGESDAYWMRKRYIHASGNIVWVNLQVWAVRDDEQRMQYLVGMVQPAAAQGSSRIGAR